MDKKEDLKKVTSKKPQGMAFGPGQGMQGVGEKAKDFKGSLKKLANYLKPFWKSIILVVFFAIVSTTFAILSPRILGNITNNIVSDYLNITIYNQVTANLPQGMTIPPGTTGADLLKNAPQEEVSKIPSDKLDQIKALDFSTRPQFNFDIIAQTGLFLIALYLLSSIFTYIQGWIMTGATQEITFRFRRDISEKINKLPLSYFDKKTYGDVLSRITNDVDTVSQNLNQSLTQLISAITTIIGILIMMLLISVPMTVIALLTLPISFFFIGFVIKKSQTLFFQQQQSLGEINGHVEEMYAGHNIVKVFNREDESLEKFNKINNDLYVSGWKSQFFSGLLFPITNIISNLGYIAIAVLGGWLAINGKIQIGDIQAFMQYMQQFNQPIMQTANIANVLQSTAAAAERVFEFLDEPSEIEESKNPVVIKNIKGNVEFNNVKFGYDPSHYVINGFNSKIKAGQRVAIVGPTGAGKTTMVNLLMRFYDVNKGSIKVDGIDIRNMRRSDLRKLFGMVLQDTWLFNGTIRDNIRYGKLDASEEEIINAAQTAHVDHFVHSLPDGYDMILNEEADNISQGEKQLLTIARAMLANPPILILDEATSSVDTRTEVLIQKAMDNLMQGRTSFVIAHRLSTIKDADLILVMRSGNIVEQGTHEELLAQKGFYASIYESQFSNGGDIDRALKVNPQLA